MDGAESLSSRLNPVESQQLPNSPGFHLLINNLGIILERFAFVICDNANGDDVILKQIIDLVVSFVDNLALYFCILDGLSFNRHIITLTLNKSDF